jgi:hypothetical protein
VTGAAAPDSQRWIDIDDWVGSPAPMSTNWSIPASARQATARWRTDGSPRRPARPQDSYALSKYVGEVICDALVRRADAAVVSVRPSLVVTDDMYPGLAATMHRAPTRPFPNQWSYADADDLAELVLLAAAGDTTGHEVVYAAQPDNLLGRPLAELLHEAYGDTAPPLRELARPDAGGIAIDKARRLFGWNPRRSWRDHLLHEPLAVNVRRPGGHQEGHHVSDVPALAQGRAVGSEAHRRSTGPPERPGASSLWSFPKWVRARSPTASPACAMTNKVSFMVTGW